jgi:hypothetical protein
MKNTKGQTKLSASSKQEMILKFSMFTGAVMLLVVSFAMMTIAVTDTGVADDIAFDIEHGESLIASALFTQPPPDMLDSSSSPRGGPGTATAAQPNAECGQIPTDACSITISTTFQRGTYYLPSGISAQGNNIKLDCNGSTLYGDGPTTTFNGVFLYNYPSNFTLKNCIIKNYGTGIYITNNVVLSLINTSFLNSNTGVVLDASCNVNIVSNIFMNNSRGMVLQDYNMGGNFSSCSYGFTIENNTYMNNTYKGISIFGNTQYPDLPYTIKGNKFFNHSMGSIFITNTIRAILITKNTFLNNAWYEVGIYGGGRNIEIANNVGTKDLSLNGPGHGNWHGIYIAGLYGDNENIFIHDNNLSQYRSDIFIDDNWGQSYGSRYVVAIHNKLTQAYAGVLHWGFYYRSDLEMRENNITGNTIGYWDEGEVNTTLYLNNIYSNSRNVHIITLTPHEFSYGRIGNYWGHTNSSANTSTCYLPGSDDDNYPLGYIHDSYPFCAPVTLSATNINVSRGASNWHLISFNVMPTNATPAKVLKSIDGKYNLVKSSLNGINQQYIPGNPFNTLTSMDPWHAYWIKINSTLVNGIIVVGNKIPGCNPLALSGTTTNNKHLIGYWVTDARSTPLALKSIAGNYSFIQSYKNGAWQTYTADLPQYSDLLLMKEGQGYQIKMKASDSVDYVCG